MMVPIFSLFSPCWSCQSQVIFSIYSQSLFSISGAEDQAGLCAHIITTFSFFLFLVTIPVSLCMCVKVVQEYERAVIFRLGRLRAGGAKGPGLFFIMPCIDTYKKVDLRTVSFDVPPQEVKFLTDFYGVGSPDWLDIPTLFPTQFLTLFLLTKDLTGIIMKSAASLSLYPDLDQILLSTKSYPQKGNFNPFLSLSHTYC